MSKLKTRAPRFLTVSLILASILTVCIFTFLGVYMTRRSSVTIGEVGGKAPRIGDGCLIGAGAVLVGDIRVGCRVKIGAGAVVSADVPDGCTVVSQPARILPGKPETE